MMKLFVARKFTSFPRFYVSQFRNTKTSESRQKLQVNELERRKRAILQNKGRRKFTFSRPLTPEFEFDGPMSIAELSVKLGIPLDDFVRGLKGTVKRDEMLNMDKVEELCLDLDVLAVRKKIEGRDIHPFEGMEDIKAPPRPAIVTIMGHVDHGKTTLMDKLRNANVAESEFGGITQHIGAFEVKINDEQVITFIDTPGHAAFTKMREAGAETTDIVVLVIAADDGIMAQTKEAISQALNAQVKIIVAINKIDKIKFDSAVLDIEKDLLNYGVRTEKMGGSVPVVEISALHEKNLDKLLEEIVFHGTLLELRAQRDCNAECVVIENHIQPGLGLTTSAIVRRGTLKNGAWLVSGTTYGRVKYIADYLNTKITEALPSKPCQIVAFKEQPHAGDYILQVASEEEAIEIVEYRKKLLQNQDRQKKSVVGNVKMSDTVKHMPIILKCDVTGTLDAVNLILTKFPRNEAVIDVFTSGVGKVTESDIKNAKIIGGPIVTMSVKNPAAITKMARDTGIVIHNFRIIYQLTEFFRTELSKLLPEDVRTESLGIAEIKKVFEFENKKERTKQIVGGGIVMDGVISTRATHWTVTRNKVKLDGTFKLESLRIFKNEVESVGAGSEFGIIIGGYAPQEGDLIEAILETRTKRDIKLLD